MLRKQEVREDKKDHCFVTFYNAFDAKVAVEALRNLKTRKHGEVKVSLTVGKK